MAGLYAMGGPLAMTNGHMILPMKHVVGLTASILVIVASIVHLRTKSRRSLLFMVAALFLLTIVIVLVGMHIPLP